MGLFLATRVPSTATYCLFGAVLAAAAVVVATFPEPDRPTPEQRARIWDQHGCPKAYGRLAARVDQPHIFVGPMSDGGIHRVLLQETTRATIAARRPGWHVEVTDKASTEVDGFYLEGTVEDLDTNSVPRSRSTVQCGVSFWLATAGAKKFAVTSGSAHVLTSRDPKDVELSRDACVQSVVEDLIENKLINVIEHPTLDDFTPIDREY